MKRILILTAIMVAAFAVNAFAAESNPTSENSVVTVTIPVVFQLNVVGSIDASISPTEAQIIAGSPVSSTTTGNLQVRSNYNQTTLTASATNFAPVSPTPGTRAIVVSLDTNAYDSAGASTVINTNLINNGSPTGAQNVFSAGASGFNGNLGLITYTVSNLDVGDDQGTFSSTVTYTLSGSNP